MSGITRFQSGQCFTVTGDTSIGNLPRDFAGGDIQLPSDATVTRWFQHAGLRHRAGGSPRQRGRRPGAGPGVLLWDLSLRKRFAVYAAHQRGVPGGLLQRVQPGELRASA